MRVGQSIITSTCLRDRSLFMPLGAESKVGGGVEKILRFRECALKKKQACIDWTTKIFSIKSHLFPPFHKKMTGLKHVALSMSWSYGYNYGLRQAKRAPL